MSDIFGTNTSFHNALKPKRLDKTVNQIILRIMKHVREYQIRISQYFEVSLTNFRFLLFC